MPASLLYIEKAAFYDCSGVTIKVPSNSGIDVLLENCLLGDDCTIIKYDAPVYEKTEYDMNRLKKFLVEMKYKREKNDYEFLKEMGLLTKEEYDKENALYLDMMIDRDYLDDL